MLRTRLGRAGLGGLSEVWPICYNSELNADWRASPTFLLVPTHPGTCLCSLTGAMSWDSHSRAAWEFSAVDFSQPLLKHVLRIVKTPRGPDGAYGRMLTMTQFSCHLATEAAMVQKMVCDSQFHLHTSCMSLGEPVICFELQFPSL